MHFCLLLAFLVILHELSFSSKGHALRPHFIAAIVILHPLSCQSYFSNYSTTFDDWIQPHLKSSISQYRCRLEEQSYSKVCYTSFCFIPATLRVFAEPINIDSTLFLSPFIITITFFSVFLFISWPPKAPSFAY